MMKTKTSTGYHKKDSLQKWSLAHLHCAFATGSKSSYYFYNDDT